MKERKKEILGYIRKGLCLIDIAKILGLTRSRVTILCKKYGINYAEERAKFKAKVIHK